MPELWTCTSLLDYVCYMLCSLRMPVLHVSHVCFFLFGYPVWLCSMFTLYAEPMPIQCINFQINYLILQVFAAFHVYFEKYQIKFGLQFNFDYAIFSPSTVRTSVNLLGIADSMYNFIF